jgi:hypothetical protein
MITRLAIAVAAMLVTGSVQAAPVQPGPADVSALRTPDRPPRRPHAPFFHATFSGTFVDFSGGRHNTIGRGDFWLIDGEGSETLLKYSVTVTALPTSYPDNPIDLGQMVGEGPADFSRAPELIAFSIRGTRNERGSSLDVDGVISRGEIEGIFRISADSGAGQGNFTGH